jgi:hypothetical protein
MPDKPAPISVASPMELTIMVIPRVMTAWVVQKTELSNLGSQNQANSVNLAVSGALVGVFFTAATSLLTSWSHIGLVSIAIHIGVLFGSGVSAAVFIKHSWDGCKKWEEDLGEIMSPEKAITTVTPPQPQQSISCIPEQEIQ